MRLLQSGFSLTEILLYRNVDVDHSMIDFDEGNALGIDFNFSVEDVPIEDFAVPFSPAVCQSDAGTQRLNQTPKKRKVCTSFN
jgi:hypothetical protein